MVKKNHEISMLKNGLRPSYLIITMSYKLLQNYLKITEKLLKKPPHNFC